MAYEKISESHIREEKIKILKERALKEIAEYKPKAIVNLNKLYLLDKEDKFEDIDYFINQYYLVLLFEKYLNSKYCFKGFRAEYPEQDIIIYYISDKVINIWLEETSVLFRYLNFFEHDKKIKVNLNDTMFDETSFTTCIESILYDEKHKEDN